MNVGIERGSPDVALSDRTSEECHDFFGSSNLSSSYSDDDEFNLGDSFDAFREETHSVQSAPELDITGFLLRHLKSKIENGMSQEATMEGLWNLYDYVFSNLSTL